MRIAILGIMLGLSVMILSIAIVKGFKSEIREKVRGFSGDIQINKYDLNSSYENSPFTLNPDTIKLLKSNKAITYLQAFATKPGIINTSEEVEGVVLKGVDKDYSWKYFESILVAGKVLDFTDPGKVQKQIMISQFTAERLKLRVGDNFLMYFVQQPLRKRKFLIVGIYNLGVEEVDKMFVIGDLSLIQRLNNWEPNQVGGYELRVKQFEQLDAIQEQVNNQININLKSSTVIQSYPIIFQWLSLLDVNTQVILALMLAVAVINMISALLIMILERINMIGILKALGSSNLNIRKIFLYNAAYLIGIGLLLGNILGVGIGVFQSSTHFLKLDQASYYIKFVPIQLEFLDILLLNIATLTICILVLIVPSLIVTRISPVKAISFK